MLSNTTINTELKTKTIDDQHGFPASSYVPIPDAEHPIYNHLIHYRHQLYEFKKHKRHLSTFEDINRLSTELGKIMDDLRRVRSAATVPTDRNKIDDMLDYVWTVLFKEWVHIAGVGEPLYPFYAKLATLMRQLELLKNYQAYSLDDLKPLSERLHILELQMADNGVSVAPSSQAFTSDVSFNSKTSEAASTDKGASESMGVQVLTGEHMVNSMLKRIHRNLKYMTNFASSVPSELVEIHDELTTIHFNLKSMVDTDEYTEEDLTFFVAKLGEIDGLRTKHGGLFLSIPIAQASTLALLFKCYDYAIVLHMRKIKVEEPAMQKLYQSIVDIELALTSIYEFERYNVSIVNLREFETKLKDIRAVEFESDAYKMSSGSSKLVLMYHLARSHHLIRTLLLGVEDLSESLVSVFESLMSLHFKARNELFKAIRHESGHHALRDIRYSLTKIIEEKQDKKTGIFYGSDISGLSEDVKVLGYQVPIGQTVIKSLLEEVKAQSDLMEAWLTIF